MDPLTSSYPWYTPYQFAGNKPINSIDLDGLEELWTEKARRIYDEAKAQLNKETAAEVIASGIGSRDALHNNYLLGIPDLTRDIRGFDPLEQFNTVGEKKAYLRGRIIGDGISMAQSIIQMGGGEAITIAGAGTGPGAVIISTGGAAITAHGAGVGYFALEDLLESFIVYNSIDEDGDDDPVNGDESNGNSEPERFQEKGLSGSKKHGIKWQEARARAKSTGNPQGKFGQQSDIDFAIEKAKLVPENSVGNRDIPMQDFLLPEGHKSTVTFPDGSVKPATHVKVGVYKGGKVHTFPIFIGT